MYTPMQIIVQSAMLPFNGSTGKSLLACPITSITISETSRGHQRGVEFSDLLQFTASCDGSVAATTATTHIENHRDIVGVIVVGYHVESQGGDGLYTTTIKNNIRTAC